MELISIPTRKEIAKFFEGMNVSDLENAITKRHNNALVFHAQQQEKQIKELEELIDILFELAKSKVLIPSELYKRIEALKK